MAAAGFGVNVIGPISGNFGLCVAARATMASLANCGIPTRALDIKISLNPQNIDTTWNHLFVPGDRPLPHPVNIVHLNPLDAARLWAQHPHLFAGAFNAIVPFWELARVPPPWIAALADFDMILAPSAHVAAAIGSVSNVPIRPYPIGIVAQPAAGGAAREHFGLANDRFLFATSFDTGSGLNRKNPFGTVRAFDLAFAHDDGVQLLVKVNGALRTPEFNALLHRMQSSPRYRVITEYLPYPELLRLFDACDAYVSLHRAEGLGLGMMEAMSMGKPTIATGWSGNVDFMHEANACPVRFTFTPVIDGHAEYQAERIGRDAVWAEPDLHHAIALMRRVRSDAAYRERIGREAHRSMELRTRNFLTGQHLASLLESYESSVWERGAARKTA